MSYSESLQRPKVLVLLASYNGREWVNEQIASILAQEGVDVSLIVSDDLSRDGTREVVSADWRGDERVCLRLPTAASGSAGANFRRLFRDVDGDQFDYVALADQDDIWDPRKLCIAVDILKDSGASGYSCAVESFWPSGQTKVIPQNPKMRATDFLLEGGGQGCTFVLTGSFFGSVSSFCREHHDLCERLHYHDWLVYLLARAWGKSWIFDQLPWMRYRQHVSNEIGSRGSLKSISRRLEMIKNGWYKGQVCAALNVYEKTNSSNCRVVQFAKLFRAEQSLGRRAKMVVFVLRHGRRRLSDRVVLAVSVAAGWL